MPLLKEIDIEYPVRQYIQLLEQMGLISELEEGVFKVVNHFSLPSTSDESQVMERIFYNEHKLMIEKGNIHNNE